MKMFKEWIVSRFHALRGNAVLAALRRERTNTLASIRFGSGRGAAQGAFPRRAWEREDAHPGAGMRDLGGLRLTGSARSWYEAVYLPQFVSRE
jgi:hypothetical protein